MEKPAEHYYALTHISNVEKGKSHYKLQTRRDTPQNMVCFEIVSTWHGTDLEKPFKTLVSVEPEEFEAVKNFLLTLRN